MLRKVCALGKPKTYGKWCNCFGGNDGKVWCEISSLVVNSERFVSEFWVVGFCFGKTAP